MNYSTYCIAIFVHFERDSILTSYLMSLTIVRTFMDVLCTVLTLPIPVHSTTVQYSTVLKSSWGLSVTEYWGKCRERYWEYGGNAREQLENSQAFPVIMPVFLVLSVLPVLPVLPVLSVLLCTDCPACPD